MRLRIIIALVVLVVAAVAWRFASTGSAPQIGTIAPEFTLASQDGSPVSVKDYRDKWVVLYFYPKDFTGGCTIEAHNFQRDQEQYSKRNAIVLGVSVDSADSHKRFCAN
jgi:thioredoxin-dependent peroxiredoxin